MSAAIAPAAVAKPDRGRLSILWVAWRLQRNSVTWLALLAAATASMLVITGVRDHSTGSVTTVFGPVVLNGWPVLAGMFAGAPMLAREFETGTQQFTFTQDCDRGRWVLGRLAFAAATCAAVACVLGVLASWWLRPFRTVADGPWWPGPDLAMITPILLAGWTLFGLIVGAAVGAIFRRTLRAIAATCAIVGVLGYLMAVRLDGALLSLHPLAAKTTPGVLEVCGTTCTQSVPPPGQVYGAVAPGGYTVSGWFTGPAGRLSPAAANRIVAHMPARVASSDHVHAWLAARHLTYWIAYQPASRYLLFQWAEFGLLLAASAMLAVMTVAVVRRRS